MFKPDQIGFTLQSLHCHAHLLVGHTHKRIRKGLEGFRQVGSIGSALNVRQLRTRGEQRGEELGDAPNAGLVAVTQDVADCGNIDGRQVRHALHSGQTTVGFPEEATLEIPH